MISFYLIYKTQRKALSISFTIDHKTVYLLVKIQGNE